MKFLELTDVHCIASAEFSKPSQDGLTEYLQLFLKSFEWVREIALQERPDVIVFGGDAWDAMDYIDTMAISTGVKAFNLLSGIADEYIAVVGNHDYYSIEHDIHTLEVLKSMGWEVCSRISHFAKNGASYLVIPYRDEYSEEQISRLNTPAMDVVFTHVNCVGGMRRVPKHDNDTNAFTTNGIHPKWLDKVGMVLNGHYHHPSQVSKNWHNIGSLTTRTFHDKGSSARGIVTYDTETKELKRFENPHARIFEDFFLESEDDFWKLADLDLSNTYARVYYDIKLESKVQDARELFAGARLIPQKPEAPKPDILSYDARFSLEENLQKYIDKEYGDEGLKGLAVQVLRAASEDWNVYQSREPLEFGVLDIHNYQQIKRATIDLRNRGLLCVRGINHDDQGQSNNGAGKTTLFQALYWCLTKIALNGYTGSDVIHWDEDWCRVSQEIFVGSSSYTIIRSIKDPEYGTGVTLFYGAESIGARLSRCTDRKIEELLGRSEEVLRSHCFLTTDNLSRFPRLTPSKKAKLLEDTINVQPYMLSQKLASQKLSETTIKYSNIEGRVETTQGSIDKSKARITELTKLIAEAEVAAEAARKAIDEEISKLEASLKSREEREQKYRESNATAQAELDTLTAKRDAFVKDLNARWRVVQELTSSESVSRADLARWHGLENKESCPICETPVNQGSVKSHVSDLTAAVNAAAKARKDAEDGIAMVQQRVDNLKEAMNLRAAIVNQTNNDIRRLQEDKSGLVLEINSAKSRRAQVSSQKTQLEAQLAECEQQLLSATEALSKLLDEETELEDLKSKYEIIAHEIFDEAGVRNSILSQIAVPFINYRLPHYISKIWPGLKLELSASRSLKSGDVRNELDVEFDGRLTYKGCSEGQKARVDLMFQLALHDLAVATGESRIGFLAADEILDKMDDTGIAAAKLVLEEKALQGTVLLITHSKYAASLIHKQVVMTKRGGSTTLSIEHGAEVMP